MGGDLGRDIDVDVDGVDPDTVKGLMSGQVGGDTQLVASIGGWATPAILNGCLFWSSILVPGLQYVRFSISKTVLIGFPS